jgi:hypothetical protein
MKTLGRNRFHAMLMAALLGGACAGSTDGEEPGPNNTPEEGHAFLTIVGDRNVFIEGGGRVTLSPARSTSGSRAPRPGRTCPPTWT